ncbi:phosphotransferase family protein [Halorubellus sp. JP-L1]|uniref:phosphotransferase family protein n=1 Tax=Halorubellus sp. JP-L1 TaxID=2715753 RepID=UPI001408175A|nr:phosphotransferase family protein [Halorubellus sp. JP-L1]NHN41023.1 phosphotransferase family protein [Halorubellus sp. JP-L1]
MIDERPDVDAAALEAAIERELDVDVASIDVLADGLNLLLSVSTRPADDADDDVTDDAADAADAVDDAYVVRAPRKLRNASYMNDVRTEYAVMEALADAPVPTPEPVLFCADASVLDEPFFAMTRLDGDVVPLGSDLPERWRTPAARERFGAVLVDALADVHAVDVDAFEGTLEPVTPAEQVERSRARLDAATNATELDVPALDRVRGWLREHAPPADDVDRTLVHGDFRPGNVLFADDDEPAVAGVLDWETALLGDPLTELGYLLLRWRDAGDPTPSLDDVVARYGEYEDAIEHLRRVNDRGFAPYTSDPGSPSRRDLVERYEAASGRNVADLRFYVALAAFNLATVWADLHRHAVLADAPSDHPPHVEHLAAVAELVVDGDLEI